MTGSLVAILTVGGRGFLKFLWFPPDVGLVKLAVAVQIGAFRSVTSCNLLSEYGHLEDRIASTLP